MDAGGRSAKRPDIDAPAGIGMNREVVIRWESSLPARTAEWVTHEAADPGCHGEYDVIAGYDAPGSTSAGRKTLAGD
jgi:hypothetical protein